MKTKQEQSSFELIYQEKKKEKQSYSVIKKCLHAENFPRNVYMHCEKKDKLADAKHKINSMWPYMHGLLHQSYMLDIG